MFKERITRWREDSLLRRVVRNSSYLFSSNAVSAALGLLQQILATRLIGVDGYGLEIVERVPLITSPNDENRSYLDVKRDKLGHLFAH